MNKNAYRGDRFPPAIIQLAVRMYACFTLSLRDVEEFLAERGLDISYETVRRQTAASHLLRADARQRNCAFIRLDGGTVFSFERP